MECDRDPDYEITQVVKEQMRIREDAGKYYRKKECEVMPIINIEIHVFP